MWNDPLPNDKQRRQLCELIHAAFIELRGISDNSHQVFELADVFHNLPVEMYGWGTWRWKDLRSRLARYRSHFPLGGPDYAEMLDGIRMESPPEPR